MAVRAHSTRTPLLPLTGARPPLLPQGPSRQVGPVTRAISVMRAADPDSAIAAIREGLDEFFDGIDLTVDFDAPNSGEVRA